MRRLSDIYKSECVLAPASVAASTTTTTGFIDAHGKSEITFHVALAALAKGKSLTVGIYASDAAAGTGAVKVAEKKFTAGDAMTKVLAVASYKPSPLNGRYIGVKLSHDSSDAVICSVNAHSCARFLPAENAWKLEA